MCPRRDPARPAHARRARGEGRAATPPAPPPGAPGHVVVVAEKPSVARDLARALGVRGKHEGYLEGEGLRITWCRGHLLELENPSAYDPRWRAWDLAVLPMIPAAFRSRVRAGAEDQWAVVRALLRDRGARGVVNACDAGREGELIFRTVYDEAGCALPVRRLWVASMTDAALQAAWADLRDGAAYDRLGDAARCRSEADWIVGLNATRALTCLARQGGGGQLLSVGRVQTPTLRMIVDRDREIEAFVPETFWRVEASCRADGGAPPQLTMAFTTARPTDGEPERPERPDRPGDEDDLGPRAERLPRAEAAEFVAAALRGRVGRVRLADRVEKREPPPLLYDLTSLQRRANQRFGLSAARTLDIAQALYERHKLLTYPRTDSRHLTPEQFEAVPDVLRGISAVPVYGPTCAALLAAPLRRTRRLVDAAEVGDHHAILPTGRSPLSADLSIDEKRIFDLVARRLLAALSPDARFELTTLGVEVDPGGAPLPPEVPPPLWLRARGRVCRDSGWQAIDPPPRRPEVELPLLQIGDEVHVEDAQPLEGKTRPPRPYNDASLLLAMETAGRAVDDAELKRALRHAGLGTPATRAATLQTLIERSYVDRDGRDLRATPRGCSLIDAVPVEGLKSPALTGQWELRLARMEDGQEARPRFMADVAAYVQEVVAAIAGAAPPPPEAGPARDRGESLGDCPLCAAPVRELPTVYACDTGRACPLVIGKTIAHQPVSRSAVKLLLKGKRAGPFKRFRSKAGKPFEASLELNPEGRVVFVFDDGPRARPKADPPAAGPAPPAPSEAPPADPAGSPCPACGEGRLIRGRAAWGCSRWREGCGFRLGLLDGERPWTAEALRAALEGPG